MGKSKAKERLDKYYHLAKEQGYRSRAAFKLIQIDAKFSFLGGAHAVLDLCAAPGGWMQVAVQRVPVGSLVFGVDLYPIRPIRGAIAVQEDITQPKCRSVIKKHLSENGFMAFDVVLHDGSPNIGGAWAQEATIQNSLVIDSIKLATEFLALKGTFVTKVFRSQDYNNVLYCLRQLFERVEVTKPASSRASSAEIFVVGLKYKAPAKIDPRLLDVKHLFQGATEPPKAIDVLRDSKQKRHRDGYEDDVSLVRKSCSAADFVWSDNPLDLLGTVTSISFKDLACLSIKEHHLMTDEVKSLCDDLRVLSKQDFKHLLKWRTYIRKALSSTRELASTNMECDNQNKDEDEKDEDEKILDEMEELTNAVERKKKRQKKLLAKRRVKEKAWKALGTQIDVLEDGYNDNELFSLASIKGKKNLAAVDASEDVDDGVEADVDENNEIDKRSDVDLSSDLDSDEERNRYDKKLEELLDEAYERVVAQREGSTRQRKRAKQAYEDEQVLEDNDDNEDASDHAYDTDMNEGDNEANPLVVPMSDRPLTQEEITAQWFSQDIFAEAKEDIEEDPQNKGENDDEMEVDGRQDPEISLRKKAKEHAEHEKSLDATKLSQNKQSKAEDDFEIVPAPATDSSNDSSSSDDLSDEYDVDTKAEILAFAKKMLRKKKREEIIDDGYNKYMFDDDVKGLPKWFVEEEKRHHQPVKPVTKEEIAAMKAQFKGIDARPVKKVAEAKARKKRAAMRKLEKIRKKANSISGQSDIPDRSKRRMIEQLYKKAAPKKRKEYVVAKKGLQVRPGKGKVLVDRRMKKDARKHGMRMEKKGKKNTKGGKGKGKGKGPVKAKGGSRLSG